MIADVYAEGGQIGLQLHPDKTKIMHNCIGYGSGVRTAKIEGMDIEVLGVDGSAMYLGRALSLTDTRDTELAHRIKKGWAKFGTYRQELNDKAVPPHLRLKLCHSVVTPTILYGCCSWVMTTSREAALRATQMKMMRALLGRRRKIDHDIGEVETWVTWLQNATSEVSEVMEKHGIPHWSDVQRQSARQWEQRVAMATDQRWTKVIYEWTAVGRRSHGHPRKRWTDQLIQFSS